MDGWKPKQIERLKKLWPSAMTIEELADRIGVTAAEIRGKAKELSLPTRSEARKQHAAVRRG